MRRLPLLLAALCAAAQPPAVFTTVRLHHLVTGYDVDAMAVEDAIHLSEQKYCSVGAMISKTAAFTTTFEVVQEAADAARVAAAH